MPRASNRYKKGRRWEYEVRDRLIRHGWTVLRMAGSKPVDLIAIQPFTTPLAVECRVGRKPSMADIKRNQSNWAVFGFRYIVAVKKHPKRRR